MYHKRYSYMYILALDVYTVEDLAMVPWVPWNPLFAIVNKDISKQIHLPTHWSELL